MSDIAMCGNAICASKDTCYRYKATPSLMQSYQDFVPIGGRCSSYIEARSKSQIFRLDTQLCSGGVTSYSPLNLLECLQDRPVTHGKTLITKGLK